MYMDRKTENFLKRMNDDGACIDEDDGSRASDLLFNLSLCRPALKTNLQITSY